LDEDRDVDDEFVDDAAWPLKGLLLGFTRDVNRSLSLRPALLLR
jgi:hypothetical protein